MRSLLTAILALFLTIQHARALPATLISHSLIDGSKVEISLKDGTTKVFVFVSATCPCSESHEEILKSLSKEFGKISFIAVHSNANESPKESKEHFSKTNFPFLILQDDSAKIADEFGALKTPHAFVVNGTGDVIFSGGVTNSANAKMANKQYLKEALLSVQAEKLPEPKVARALGCVITRP